MFDRYSVFVNFLLYIITLKLKFNLLLCCWNVPSAGSFYVPAAGKVSSKSVAISWHKSTDVEFNNGWGTVIKININTNINLTSVGYRGLCGLWIDWLIGNVFVAIINYVFLYALPLGVGWVFLHNYLLEIAIYFTVCYNSTFLGLSYQHKQWILISANENNVIAAVINREKVKFLSFTSIWLSNTWFLSEISR